MHALDTLINIGCELSRVGKMAVLKDNHKPWLQTAHLDALWLLLEKKNGFVAFENALIVFPLQNVQKIPGIFDWNDPKGWRRHYGDLVPPEAFFFAQDAFAGQFALTPKGVIKLEPESGSLTRHSESLGDWASKILQNYDYDLGWSIAKHWQAENGPIPPGYRLLGRRPFVLGGDYVNDNLIAIENSVALEKLGLLYLQLKGVPDGQEVTIKGWL